MKQAAYSSKSSTRRISGALRVVVLAQLGLLAGCELYDWGDLLHGSGGSSSGGSGSGGAPDKCEPNAAGNDDCQKCVETACCAEYLACTTAECAGDGTSANPGELACFHQCISDAVTDTGSADSDTVAECAGQCAVGSALADDTQELVTCILGEATDAGPTGCSVDCYTVDLSN